MKKLIFSIFLISFSLLSYGQKESTFQSGEFLKFRLHYGFINAGFATLEVKEVEANNQKMYRFIGNGYSTGMTRMFFKVNDLYESYIDKNTGKTYRFIRKINEGGYTKNQEGFFDQTTKTVLVKNYKEKTEKTFQVSDNIQDILSAFYFLRNYPNIDKMKMGDSITVDLFFDDEINHFKLKFLGREIIETEFGNINTMIFKPLVQSGRVFKEQESVTVWISDDSNKIPLRIKAALKVGSLKADLASYKGLKYPLKTK